MQILKRKNKRVNKRSQYKAIYPQFLDAPDKDGMYPIHIAIQTNDLGTLDELISKSVNLNRYNRERNTPLLIAIKENNPQIVEKLLEEGAEIDKTDGDQNSPLEVATRLGYQECIDLLAEYNTSSRISNDSNAKNLSDRSYEFVDKLIALLTANIATKAKLASKKHLIGDVILLLEQSLNLDQILESTKEQLYEDINHRVTQFMRASKDMTEITKKNILNLARKIIVIIQDYKQELSTNSVWNLNRIESRVEEKIVSSNVEVRDTPTHVFVTSRTKDKPVSNAAGEENWYSRNGYKDFDEFVRINSSGAGPAKHLKFINIQKENVLQNTRYHGTETLEVINLRPLQVATKEVFDLLFANSLKRIEEEKSLIKYNAVESSILNHLLPKAKNGTISLEESLTLDKAIRPGKKHRTHIIHFHHSNEYENFWDDFAEEAFLTGSTMHLFKSMPKSNEKIDLIYSGIAIVNSLLDNEVHPDKIILQSYGRGYLISKAVRNQFQKRGIDMTQINYQHSLFSPSIYPKYVCNHRRLHICTNKLNNKKICATEDPSHEFSKFATYIAKILDTSKYNSKFAGLSGVSCKNYSLSQLINIFISTNQHFLQENLHYKNPGLPDERVEKILGIVNLT